MLQAMVVAFGVPSKLAITEPLGGSTKSTASRPGVKWKGKLNLIVDLHAYYIAT